MVSVLKKSFQFLARGLLAIVALLFVALIALQIILVVGINAVSTGGGTNFIEGKINQALEPSGYQVDLAALYYDPVRGLTIHDFLLSDIEGAFLTLDRVSIAPSFMLSPLKTLELSIKGGTLSLERIPASEEAEAVDEEQTAPMQPFETPNIYFRKIILTLFSFEKIMIGKEIAGTAYEISPVLRASIALQDNIDLLATLRPGMGPLAEGVDAPELIEVDASLTPMTLSYKLNRISLSAPSYSLGVAGEGSLTQDGTIAIEAHARHDDLSILTADSIKSASAQMIVTGPSSTPAIDLTADIVTGSLKERGLSDINISVKTADVTQGASGAARIATMYRDEPIILEADLAHEESLLRISDLRGSAPAITLSGGGHLSMETMLFDGIVNINASDLARYSELAGVTIGGSLKASAALKPSASAEQSAEIEATIADGAYESYRVRSLSAQASMASLSNPWPQSAKVDAGGIRLAESTNFNKISVVITQGQGESYKLTLSGNGAVPIPVAFDGSASLSNLTQSVPDARDIILTVKQGASSLKLSGELTTEAVNLALTAKDFRGSDIPAGLPDGLDNLRINLDAAMIGTPAAPKTNLSAQLRGIGAGPYQNATIDLKAQHDGQTLSADITGKGEGIRALNANASAPMTLSLIPFDFAFDTASALTGNMAADIDLAAIAPLFLPPTQELSGTFIANGKISGTVASPAPEAAIRLSNVSFEDGESGIVIDDLAASANITPQSLTLSSLSATDGGDGTINGRGTMQFSGGATDLSLQMRNFNAPRSTLANGIIGADLSLKGTAEGLLLSGQADIEEMQVTIPETFSSSIPQLNIVEDEKRDGPGFLENLALDIAINANNQMFVRGWGLDAEFEGSIAVSGTASAPQMNGTLSSRRGRYEEFGKRFTLARANLRFQGDVPPSPYLDIEATTPAGDVTGSILLSGPVASPSISFASTPALPEDEVLSRILFGKDSARISPFQAVQLAQAVRRFSGQGSDGGLDPLGMLRDATGFDDISVEMDESGGANVNVGKYLTDNVYLELGRGRGENSGEATIKIEVTPSINVESEIGQDAQGGGGIFWKRDY